MNAGILIVGLAVLLAAMWFGALWFSVALGRRRRDARIHDALTPVRLALAEGRTPSVADIHAFALDPFTRNHLGELLSEAGQLELFPEEFRNPESLAESDLAVWLAHPHELGAVPRLLTCTERVPRSMPDGFEVDYFVFSFRIEPPHPAARDGAMAAVAGPYILDGDVVLYRGASSRSYFEAFASRTPEQHMDRVHQKVLSGPEAGIIAALVARWR